MIPGDPLQTEQGGSGTDADNGMALVQDEPQSGVCSRIELDSDDGQRPPAGLDERGHLAGHLNAFVDEQGIDRSRFPAGSRASGHTRRNRWCRPTTRRPGQHRQQFVSSSFALTPHWLCSGPLRHSMMSSRRRREVGGHKRQIGVADLGLPEGGHERHAMPDHQRLCNRGAGRCAVPERRGGCPGTSAGEPGCPALPRAVTIAAPFVEDLPARRARRFCRRSGMRRGARPQSLAAAQRHGQDGAGRNGGTAPVLKALDSPRRPRRPQRPMLAAAREQD